MELPNHDRCLHLHWIECAFQIQNKSFQECVKNTYQVATGSIMATEDGIDEELSNIKED